MCIRDRDYNGVAFTIEKNDSSGIFLVQYNINGEPHANDNWVYVFQEKKTTDQGYKKRIYVQDSNKNLITMQHYHKENPNWGIVSCAFRDTYYDDKGRVLSEYFKDAQSNNIGDADGDSYTIWKYDDENKTEIVSLYNTEGILTLRIRKVKDSQNRIVEQSYVYIENNLSTYIKDNLNIIGNKKVVLEEVSLDVLKDYERKYEENEIIVSSIRIDSIVSSIIKSSRSKALEKIKNKEVIVNYEVMSKNSYLLKENDIFSIRRYGKYKFVGIVKSTKKDNYIVKYLKYV